MAIGYLDDSKLTAIADAIRTKAGTSGTMTVDDMPTNIAAIPSGGGAPLEPKDITFYDWDGTILYAYTFSEMNQLTELPPLPPAYKDYTAVSWTESLEFLQGRLLPINVGVNYSTSRAKTYIYITVDDITKGYVTLVNKWTYTFATYRYTVDWGDGSSTTTINGKSYGVHQYSQAGSYVVQITCNNGVVIQGEYSTSGTGVAPHGAMMGIIYSQNESLSGTASGSGDFNNYEGHNSIVTAIELGNRYQMNDSGIANMINLKSMILPYNSTAGRTTVNPYAFYFSCLEFISFPSNCTLNTPANNRSYFQNSWRLKKLVIPTSLSKTGFNWNEYMFAGCNALQEFLMDSISSGTSAVNTFGFRSISNHDYRAAQNLERVIIPFGVTSMDGVFGTASVSEIEFWQLKKIYFSPVPTLTTIANENFPILKRITEIYFPETLTTLTNVGLPLISHFTGTTPPTATFIQDMVFPLAIYAPAEAVTDYQTAWPDLASVIQAEPE